MAITTADKFQAELFDDLPRPEANEPIFENHPTILRRYWRPIQKKLSEYARQMGIQPKFNEWRVRVSELPTYKALGRIFGKVFGRYRPGEKILELDPSLIPELKHPTRYELKKQDMLKQDIEEVGLHEGIHGLQDESGALDKYLQRAWIFARTYIEGLATKATAHLTGKEQPVYRGAQKLAQRLIDKYGMRKAFRGDVAQEDVLPRVIQLQPAPAYAFVRFRYAR